ncbi:penicillin-binding transpeptidase domain-containing protein [Salipaludibacillus sp. HK11]|uniref:penicillin-binding transpeptidase domain-containing protein n=1 Tax=Salipaludibacillus sp. HK11 TaxID=3394320 RepID=UPI0039FCEC50
MKVHKRLTGLLLLLLIVMILAACSNEEPANPEDALESYVTTWSNGAFADMLELLSDESMDEISNFDWDFEERYENEYSDLSVEDLEITYQSRDFDGEEIDLEELQELDYQISIEMETLVGKLSYQTDVELNKQISLDENEDELEEWVIEWDPTHLLMGMKDAHDQIIIETEQPKRGEIFDRNGEPLAINGEIYDAGIVPDRTEDLEQTASEFAELIGLNEETVIELANRYPDNPDWPAPVQNLSVNDERIDALLEIDGVLLDRDSGREYPFGDTTGHIIGHIGAITAEQLEERADEGYHMHSEIGMNGMELLLEEDLRGDAGVSLSIKTEDGDVRDLLKKIDPINGEDVHLTLDMDLQEKMAEVLREDSGSGVVIDPISGETLVLVSEPAFDSNLRYLQLSDPRADDLDNADILFERRFQNVYSPGSIFKPFTAIAGIEEGTLDPNEQKRIEGSQWQADDSWGGYQVTRVNDSVSNVDLETALKLSDNIYFAQQALEIGEGKIEEWAEKVGFGGGFSYDFPLNSSTIANNELDRDILLADTGYGQGEVQASPVHMNALYSIFVNDGQMVEPTLFVDEDSSPVYNEISSPETADLVLDSLVQVVEDSDGTAYRSEPGHTRALAGKTGTAELKQEQTAEEGEQIGWYVSFDYEEKDLLTTIMVQNAEDKGGSGHAVNLVNEFWGMLE